jgi:hypothetical protein
MRTTDLENIVRKSLKLIEAANKAIDANCKVEEAIMDVQVALHQVRRGEK